MKTTSILRRLAAMLLAAVMLFAAAMPAFAADKVIDYVLYTDIRTYINNVEITSYNIKGYTAVVVEDLLNYGFDVVWDGEARTLKVTRNTAKAVTGAAVTATSGGKVGERAMPVYATDIKTYLDGKETNSYNVGGRTIVYVDDLAALYAADYQWDAAARTLKAVWSGEDAEPAPDTEAEAVEAEAVEAETFFTFLRKGENKSGTFPSTGLFPGENYTIYAQSAGFNYKGGAVDVWEPPEGTDSAYVIFYGWEGETHGFFECMILVEFVDKDDNILTYLSMDLLEPLRNKSTGKVGIVGIQDGVLRCSLPDAEDPDKMIYMEINIKDLRCDNETNECYLKSIGDIEVTNASATDDFLKDVKMMFELCCYLANASFGLLHSDLTVIDVFSFFTE